MYVEEGMTITTENTTRFAEHYLEASSRLMDALANPSQFAFDLGNDIS